MLAHMNLRDATQALAGELSLSREEAQRQLSAMTLEGLVAHGYAIEQNGRYAVSDAGHRMLADEADNG